MFVDTNVLVSAFATRGLCADLFREIVVRHELIIGQVVVEEFERVMGTKFKVPRGDVRALLDYLAEFETIARPATRVEGSVRDPDDEWILASALAGRADVLVTGDPDLLCLRDAGVEVLSPRQFWERLR